MALHQWSIWIEYDDRPGYPAITVILRGSGLKEQLFEGKVRTQATLTRLLNKAQRHIINAEVELEMLYAVHTSKDLQGSRLSG